MKKSTKLRKHKPKVASKQNRKKRSTRRRHTTGLPPGRPLTRKQRSLVQTLHSQHYGRLLAKAIRKGVREPETAVCNALIRTAIRYVAAKGSLRGLLWTILRNECAGAYRSQVKRAARSLPLPAHYQHIPDEERAEARLAEERYEELRAAIRCLPLKDQRLLELRYGDLALDDTAAPAEPRQARLTSQQKSRLFRLRKRLRRLLQLLDRTGRLPARSQRRNPSAVSNGSKTNGKFHARSADQPVNS